MSIPDLQFVPIDLDQHLEIFLDFIRDTHLCSFGSMKGFVSAQGLPKNQKVAFMFGRARKSSASFI